ncbi:MAG TPA: ABC transporter permease [Gammaproteobacteria bacterium]
MIDVDKWQEIYLTVKRHKLRTGLTAFGVFWGVFMLVVLLGAGKGMENGVKQSFDRMENLVFIWSSGKTTLPYAGLSKGREVRLNDDDIKAIMNNVDGVARVAPTNFMGGQNVEHLDNNDVLEVTGEYPVLIAMQPYDMVEGRFINELDIQERRKVAVIGSRVRQVLFEPGQDPVGRDIQINNVFFQVVGVFNSRRPGEDADRDSERVMVPNTTLRYIFNQGDRVHRLIVMPQPGIRSEIVEQRVDKLLRERHKVHPQDPSGIGTFNMQQEYEKVQGLFSGIRLFSWVVAIGTIIAGAIAVGNIMLIVVKERTREIGIRKALGATPRSIVLMIVQESVVITAVSGYMGLVLGVALLEVVNRLLSALGGGNRFFANPEISFEMASVAICVLIAAGLLAAWLPAAKAAAVDPILALQEE